MNALGKYLLAGSGLAHQEHIALALGGLSRQAHRVRHAPADDMVKGIPGKADLLPLLPEGSQGVLRLPQPFQLFFHILLVHIHGHRTHQLLAAVQRVGGIDCGQLPAGAQLEMVHPVQHRGSGPDGGKDGADLLILIIEVQQVPSFHIHIFRDAGDLPGGRIKVDRHAVLVVNLDSLGDLVQGALHQEFPVSRLFHQKDRAVLPHRDKPPAEALILPDQLSLVLSAAFRRAALYPEIRKKAVKGFPLGRPQKHPEHLGKARIQKLKPGHLHLPVQQNQNIVKMHIILPVFSDRNSIPRIAPDANSFCIMQTHFAVKNLPSKLRRTSPSGPGPAAGYL